MVKIFSAAVLAVATAISSVQAVFILSSGHSNGMHTVKGATCGAHANGYTVPTQTLKAGSVFCSYMPNVKMSLCQCHSADTSAKDQDGFIRDIVWKTNYLRQCEDKSGGANFINSGSWINGFYEGSQNNVMRAAIFVDGKQTVAQCQPVFCSKPSEGKSWRNFSSLSPHC
ncbi:hypothetical protein BG015_001478 [Linnemannia schmuckeri]|uniref:Secreted protein n=1 Tax=Linnemannia schmuckeri TaxID=64567 RepID=A0A9P5RT90_9FUNG|nr:hypothetical protein BG015_001478 [Linnemannia schmuckeri]